MNSSTIDSPKKVLDDDDDEPGRADDATLTSAGERRAGCGNRRGEYMQGENRLGEEGVFGSGKSTGAV